MRKIISIVLSVGLLFQQGGLVYAAGQLNLANYLNQARNAIVQPDVFQPARLRYISYDINNNDFKLLLDKGDTKLNELPNSQIPKLNDATPELFNYFLIGLALPNDTFWVNLRPDAPDNIIDPILEKTDIGKIFLEADLQLKKDTASLTSPQNPEGKSYWDKLYKKAGELFGTENITIPTITRPWIVPNEVIVRETEDSAYIYKATLKVMLEQDHLKDSLTYNFSDPRLKELNEYSSQIIRETIIPKLTKEVNSSKRYAQLRQVYYSLVLSRWFKQKYSSPGSAGASANSYLSLIDSGNLDKLASKEPCDKQTYFQAYQKSFKDGEYNLKETVSTPFGQSIRSYVSGGISVAGSSIIPNKMKTPKENMEVTKALTGQIPPVTVASPVSHGKRFEWALSNQDGVSDAAEEWVRIGLVLLKAGDMEKHRERFEWTLYHQKGSSDAAEESARIGLVLLKSGDMEKHRERFEWTLYHQKGSSDVAEELARIGLVLLKSGDMEKHKERFKWTLYTQKGASDAAEKAAEIGLLILKEGVDALFAGSPLEVKRLIKEIQSGLKDINVIVSLLSQPRNGYNSKIQGVSNPLGQVIATLQKKINYLGQIREEKISIEYILSDFGKLKDDLGKIQSAINKFVEENSLENKNGSIRNNFNDLSIGIKKVLIQAEELYEKLQNSAGSPLKSFDSLKEAFLQDWTSVIEKNILKQWSSKDEWEREWKDVRAFVKSFKEFIHYKVYITRCYDSYIKTWKMLSKGQSDFHKTIKGPLGDCVEALEKAIKAIEKFEKEQSEKDLVGSPLGELLFANGKEVGRYVSLEDLQKAIIIEEEILKLVNDTIFLADGSSGSMQKKLSLQSLYYLENTRMAIRINPNATLSLLGMAHLSPMGEIDEIMGESQEIIDALRKAWEGEKDGKSGSPLTVEKAKEIADDIFFKIVRVDGGAASLLREEDSNVREAFEKSNILDKIGEYYNPNTGEVDDFRVLSEALESIRGSIDSFLRDKRVNGIKEKTAYIMMNKAGKNLGGLIKDIDDEILRRLLLPPEFITARDEISRELQNVINSLEDSINPIKVKAEYRSRYFSFVTEAIEEIKGIQKGFEDTKDSFSGYDDLAGIINEKVVPVIDKLFSKVKVELVNVRGVLDSARNHSDELVAAGYSGYGAFEYAGYHWLEGVLEAIERRVSEFNKKFALMKNKLSELSGHKEISVGSPLTLENEIEVIIGARKALEGHSLEIVGRYWWEMSLIPLSELLEIVNKIAKGYSEFLTGDLYVQKLRKALGDNRLASEIVREELRALGVSAVNTASEEKLLIAFNNILRDRYFPKKIDGKKYESLIHIEIEPLLKRALWPNSELAGLDDLDYCRINRELLGIIYPREIRQTYALFGHEKAKELLNDILPKLLRIEREVKENMERYKKELADFFGGLRNNQSINISPDEKERLAVKYSKFNDIDDILDTAEKANNLRRYRSTKTLKTDKGKDGSASPQTGSVGSPVVGEELVVLDENGKVITYLRFVSYDKDIKGKNRVMLKDIMDKLKVTAFLSGDGGAVYYSTLDSSNLSGMYFAVELDGSGRVVDLKGILRIVNGKREALGGKNKEVINALEKKEEEIVSSAVVSKEDVSENKWGGIDLTDRALHIKLERVGSFASTPLLLPQVKNAQDLDLDKEFEQVETLASSGIVPNSHRLLELFTICHYRGEFGERLNQIISCLKASSAIQEAQAIDSDEDFRLALMMPEMLS